LYWSNKKNQKIIRKKILIEKKIQKKSKKKSSKKKEKKKKVSKKISSLKKKVKSLASVYFLLLFTPIIKFPFLPLFTIPTPHFKPIFFFIQPTLHPTLFLVTHFETDPQAAN